MAIYTFYAAETINVSELLEMIADAGCDACTEHGIDCAAVRLYSDLGTYQDMILGGTLEEREVASKALDDMGKSSLS